MSWWTAYLASVRLCIVPGVSTCCTLRLLHSLPAALCARRALCLLHSMSAAMKQLCLWGMALAALSTATPQPLWGILCLCYWAA